MADSTESIVTNNEFVTVPNLTAKKLIAKADKELKLSFLADEYKSWDFMRDEQGKTYEVMAHSFGMPGITIQEVRKYFAALGFKGNTAAFIAWVMMLQPDDRYVSIPESGRLFHDTKEELLLVPTFAQGWDDRHLNLAPPGGWEGDWEGRWVFVAFREIPKP